MQEKEEEKFVKQYNEIRLSNKLKKNKSMTRKTTLSRNNSSIHNLVNTMNF